MKFLKLISVGLLLVVSINYSLRFSRWIYSRIQALDEAQKIKAAIPSDTLNELKAIRCELSALRSAIQDQEGK